MRIAVLSLLVLCLAPGVFAASVQIGFGAEVPSTNFTDPSYETTYISSEGLTVDMTITKAGGTSETELLFTEPLNLTVFGDVQDGEVILDPTFVYVNTLLRPDLDVNATLVFRNVPFASEPELLKDGFACGSDCLNPTFSAASKTMTFEVTGFSNYSLTAKQEFQVYSDPQPELDNAPQDKVYQTIDLGDANRDEQFNCIVQLYGRNDAGQFVLVQTNPQRKAQGFIVSPDPNLPESIGYFRTTNGLANVYYDASKLAGYQDLEYVAQCANNSSKLIFEESVSTRYRPMGRSIVGRSVWFTSDNNALFLILSLIAVFIVIMLVVKFWRMVKG